MTKRPKRSLADTIAVDGRVFQWTLHREPQWCTVDGWKGMSILVQLADQARRQAVIEFPFKVSARRSVPGQQRPKLLDRQIEEGIRMALLQGWDPESRGKPFVAALPMLPDATHQVVGVQ